MRATKLVPVIMVSLAMFWSATTAWGGEWKDYLNSPYSDFRWDWLVRDGHLAYGKGKYKEALGVYQEAMDKGCKDPLMVFRMGYCYRALRKDKEAAGYFAASMKGLAKAYPKHKYNWFSRYYLAEILAEKGLLDRAKKELDGAIKRNPKFLQAFLLYGNIHYQEGNYAQAAEKYLRAHESNPKSLQALTNLAASYDALRNYEKTLESYLKAKSLSPRDETIVLAIAETYSRLGKPKEAMENYEEVLNLQPDSERALTGAANAAWEIGENDRAVEYYQKALAVNLKSYEALLGLGIAMLKMEKLEDAEKNFQKALEVRPDSKEAHYNLGVLYDSKGDFDRAIKEYVQAIAADPDDQPCYYNVGLAFIKAGLYDQAREWLNKAVEKFGKESKWSKADLKLLELIDRIEKGKESEIEKELKRAMEEKK